MKVLHAAVLFAIAAFVVHAGFVQLFHWHPPGLWQFAAPILSAGYVVALVAFLLRKPWSWMLVAMIAASTVILNLAFWPSVEYFGEGLYFAWGAFGIEIVSCAIISAIMLRPATKRWFRGELAD